VPTVTIGTNLFCRLADNMAKVNGMPDLRIVGMGEHLSGLNKAEARERAERIVDAVRRALVTA